MLPLPPFFDPANAGSWAYAPDQHALFVAAQQWRAEHRIAPAAEDGARVHLLLIDVQKDFCLPEGALFVGGRSGAGAVGDSERIARFIYANLPRITDITCTLDTHHPFQIFFASFWVDGEGAPLHPFREVTADQVRSGEARPNPALAGWAPGGDYEWLRRQALFYCEELERSGKYRLYLWPPHCVAGSDGHPLVGVVHEARIFHAYVRYARGGVELKGENPLTENYSILAPEVLNGHDGSQIAARNQRFLETLLSADAVVVAGQAASHCVRSSVDDLLAEVGLRDRRLANKIYILADCMSSVAVPDPAEEGAFLADHTGDAEAAFERWTAAGMHVVRSVDPIEEWLPAR